jgi:hypothetical protein
MRHLAVLALLALAGCAGAPPGQDAASAEQRAKALKKASDYCKKKGLVMQPAKNADTPTRPGQLAPEVQFRCVKAK